MASSLLNTLKNIEMGRQNIIHDLNLLGVPTEQNASFAKIGANLEGVSLISNNKYVVAPLGPFYDNPEDDPVVWKKPESWPDIEKLFNELVEADTKFSDTVCVIKQIIMFQTSDDTTEFANNNVSLTDNMIKGFYHLSSTKAYFMTNDGSFYEKPVSTTSVTHTWDHSKDIIGPTGEHFKYIVTFTEKNPASGNIRSSSSIINFAVGSNIILNQILTNPAYQTMTASSNYYNDTSTIVPYHVIKFDMREPKRTWVELPRMTTIRTDILITNEEIQPNTTFANYLSGIVNTLYTKDIDAKLDLPGVTLYTSAVYVRMNKLSINSVVSNSNNSSSTTGTLSRYLSRLKYLELAEGESLTCKSRIMFPCLRDIEKVIYLVKNTSSVFGPFQANTPILRLDGFPNTSNALKGLSARTLIIEDASNYNAVSGGLDYLNAEVVVLNNLKTFSKAIYAEGCNFRVLIAPDLETISASIGQSNSSYEMNNMYYLKAPKLTHFDLSSSPFTNCNSIVYLEVGEGFFGNCDMSPLKSLSAESAIDIVNKLKDLVPTGESYTITFSYVLKWTLDPSVFEIASNKGWTVSFN